MMNAKDIWYGVLEAGEKTSPVVRDASLEAGENKIYLYNHTRNQIIEYVQAIVEPRLRELATDDIPRDELDKAFKSALKAFSSTRKACKPADTKPAAPRAKVTDDEDAMDIDMGADEDADDFIDDDE